MNFNKYGNRKIVIDNIAFASQAEARRYQELKLLKKVGEIREFRVQPKYALYSKEDKLIGYYTRLPAGRSPILR